MNQMQQKHSTAKPGRSQAVIPHDGACAIGLFKLPFSRYNKDYEMHAQSEEKKTAEYQKEPASHYVKRLRIYGADQNFSAADRRYRRCFLKRYLGETHQGRLAPINATLTLVAITVNLGLYQAYPFYKRQGEPEMHGQVPAHFYPAIFDLHGHWRHRRADL